MLPLIVLPLKTPTRGINSVMMLGAMVVGPAALIYHWTENYCITSRYFSALITFDVK